MKRKEWFIILAPLFVVWFVDHITKLWGTSLSEPFHLGFLTFQLYHNHGAFLGFFSELPPLLRIVSLSTIGSFLVFSYAVIQYMLPIKSFRLRLGMSILLGGIIGNVYDRVIWGYVVDFVILDFSFITSHPMNLADIFQWVGYAFISVALVREDELLWPEQNNRKRLWINPNYQLRYILFLLIITLSLTLIGVVFSYTYLKVTIYELIGDNRYIPSRFLIPFIFTYLAISFTFCCFLVLIGRKISHRNAGPIYAFDKYVNDLLDGRNRRFKLRSGDEFKQLEKLGAKIAEFLKENNFIDSEDTLKTLTTQNESSDDFSIPAVPVDDQIPNYSSKPVDINEVAEDSVIKNRRDCPLCASPSLMFPESPFAHYLVKCTHCYFVFDPSPSLSTNQIYHDEYFIKSSGDLGFSNYQQDHEVNLINFRKRIQKALNLHPSINSYLDIGCAFGDSLEVAIEFNIQEIQGVEVVGSACEKAREKGFSVFQGTLSEAAPMLAKYDFIMVSDVIEHLDDPKKFIQQCHQLLNQNGLVMIHTPNIQSWSARLLRKRWFHLKRNEHLSFFNPRTMQNFAEENGYAVASIEKSFSYLSLGAIVRRLKIYGWNWTAKIVNLLPKKLTEKMVLPIQTGNMLVILKQQ